MELDLYHEAIVDAARGAIGAGRLEAPHASVTVDNPLCGDRVSVDVALADGQISSVAHRVRGCLLCEAAAAVIGAHAAGATGAEIGAAADAVNHLLAGEPVDDIVWPELRMFGPVAAHRSRHRCVSLPFEALAKALEDASPP